MRRRWPVVRAALITAAIALSVLQGLPIPHTDEARLRAPATWAEVERWADVLGMEPEELAGETLRASRELREAHGTLLTPVAPAFRELALNQRWNLFPVADTDPFRMHVQARTRDGDWRLLYRANDPSARYMKAQLEHRRVRALWNPGTGGPRATYRVFVDWLSRRVLEDHPDVVEVRVRFEQRHLSPPGRSEPPDRRWRFEVRRSRDRPEP